MKSRHWPSLLNGCIALVWMVNGLFAKVFGFAPRHQEIVAEILGAEHAFWATKAIGVGEIALAIWIFGRRAPRFTAAVQIALVAAMNVLEFFLTPDLLLWGRFNAVFALAFMLAVFVNGFVLNPRKDAA